MQALLLVLAASVGSGTQGASQLEVAQKLLWDPSPQERIHAILVADRNATMAGHSSASASQRVADALKLIQIPVPDNIRAIAAEGSMSLTSEGVASATATLNGMIATEFRQLDNRLTECRLQEERYTVAARSLTSHSRAVTAQVSFQRSFLIKKTSSSVFDTEFFENAKTAVKSGRRECELLRSTGTAKSSMLDQDMLTLQEAERMVESECAGTPQLLQLGQSCRGFGKQNWKQMIAQLPSLSSPLKKRIQKMMRIDEGRDDEEAAAKSRHRQTRHLRLKRHAHTRHLRLKRHATISQVEDPSEDSFLQTSEVHGCTQKLRTCTEIKSGLETAIGELQYVQAAAQKMTADAVNNCEKDLEVEKVEMARSSHFRSDSARRMAEASAALNILLEQSKDESSARESMEENLASTRQTCAHDIHDALFNQICGLRRLRDSLQIVNGATELPQDCMVSDWFESECSVPCGGGERTLLRQVLLQPVEGTQCPPLEMVLPCNENKCPQHCVVSEWSGWSSCSAACDGGIEERIRDVLTEDKYDGDACPHLVDTRMCNTQACSKPCVLHEWSEWSECSEQCGDGGKSQRFKRIKEEPTGFVTCPAERSAERFESKNCNMGPCSAESVCGGIPLDVVLLVDASGSLAADTFSEVRNLVSDLVGEYSPSASADGHLVSVGTFNDQAHEISLLSSDASAIQGAISSNMQQLQGSNKLGQGFMFALRTFLNGGRWDALPTVVVITSGNIADPYLAQEAAFKVHMHPAHLVFVVVEEEQAANYGVFNNMASWPPETFVMKVPKANLAANMQDIAHQVLANTCTELV